MNKEQFFAAIAAEVKEVEVKELNSVVKLRVLTGRARDEFHTLLSAGDKSASRFEAALVAATLVDDTGALTLTSDDVEALRDQNGVAVAAVAKAAMQVNKIGTDAEAEAAKN